MTRSRKTALAAAAALLSAGGAGAQTLKDAAHQLSPIVVNNAGGAAADGRAQEFDNIGEPAQDIVADPARSAWEGFLNLLGLDKPADQFVLQSALGPAVLLSSSSLQGKASLLGQLAVEGSLELSNVAGVAGSCVNALSFKMDGGDEGGGGERSKAPALPPCWRAGPLPPEPLPFSLAAERSAAAAANKDGSIARYLRDGALRLDDGDQLTLSAGSYLLEGLRIGDRARLSISGPVTLYVEGPVEFDGLARANDDGGDAYNLAIFVAAPQDPDAPARSDDDRREDDRSSITVSGHARLGAFVYGPRSQLRVSGQAEFAGPFLLHDLRLTGGTLAWASGHSVPAPSGGTDPDGKRVDTAAAGPSAAFRLGGVFVFPNPARPGQQPVYHVETGLADEVDIHVYDVSGQLLKTATLNAVNLVTLGGVYAYEAPVDTSGLGSGVYICAITTKKSGSSDLKTLSKFALLR